MIISSRLSADTCFCAALQRPAGLNLAQSHATSCGYAGHPMLPPGNGCRAKSSTNLCVAISSGRQRLRDAAWWTLRNICTTTWTHCTSCIQEVAGAGSATADQVSIMLGLSEQVLPLPALRCCRVRLRW
jgi:hypothetical protein